MVKNTQNTRKKKKTAVKQSCMKSHGCVTSLSLRDRHPGGEIEQAWVQRKMGINEAERRWARRGRPGVRKEHSPKPHPVPLLLILSFVRLVCLWKKTPATQAIQALRRLERVFCYCSACETIEDYKEGYFVVWANYVSLQLYCWAILWGYLWRHISYHGNAQGPQKRPLNFSFC